MPSILWPRWTAFRAILIRTHSLEAPRFPGTEELPERPVCLDLGERPLCLEASVHGGVKETHNRFGMPLAPSIGKYDCIELLFIDCKYIHQFLMAKL
ncbi:hypothetical protein [Sphaerochaeta pleomorpha]|uniref:hypothetical protein n=1 Tax=Sphaerochaeta pleomorpha TaxID=1131707 RepID=UPI0012DD10AC|nr:hypothetical protein [Sphaerochaeta pleomorpha]